jgi:hypothetical protein
MLLIRSYQEDIVKRRIRKSGASFAADAARLTAIEAGKRCRVKDDLVNRLVALNNKLNNLSPTLLHSPEARAEVQAEREQLFIEMRQHKTRGHEGKPCPAVEHARRGLAAA